MSIFILLLFMGLAAPTVAQQAHSLSDQEVQLAEQKLFQALAGPRERAFLQTLTEVRIVPDTLDIAVAYDLVVHFDPERYRDPQVGSYPLSFEDQFILWGKRIAMYSRSTSWTSGRFFLRDISIPREAWIFSEDARALYKSPTDRLPAKSDASFPLWLKLIHAVEPYTDLRTMSRWLRLMQDETRDQLIRRLQAERQRSSIHLKE